MYIVPNTVIKVLTGVRICNDYEHTIYFDTVENQRAYFSGLAKFTFNNQTYQRANKNSVRVNKCADDIYDCNYLMFQNTSYGNKWFYAFITSIDYVNNETAEINYQIDVMQTWFFECDIKMCLVERSHVPAEYDKPFIWQADEPFSPKEYIIDYDNFFQLYFPRFFDYPDYTSPFINLCCTKVDGVNTPPDMYCGVYSGLWYYSLPVSKYNEMTDFLTSLEGSGNLDAVVSLSMSPLPIHDEPYGFNFTTVDHRSPKITSEYTVRNKKLIGYPFTFIKLKSTDGDTSILKPDLIGEEKLEVYIHCACSMPPTAVLLPTYDGITDNNEYSVTYSESPECAWSGDVYKNWLAQHMYTNTLNKIAAASSIATGTAASLATGSPIGVISGVGGTASALNLWATQEDMKRLPGKLSGSPNGGSVNYSTGRIGFEIFRYVCSPQEMQIYDRFLDIYGYALNNVMTPWRNCRPHWNYLKTSGANIVGNVPADDMKEIKSIYDKGITFWVNGDEVGDYSLDNTVEEVTP